MATVLIVDDQIQARRLLGAELDEAGFQVIEAENGEVAWDCFNRRPPDVVVTDMVMPRCDGLELLRRIRSRSDVPVIIFSGHGSVESAAHAFKAGADDFVSSLDCDIDDLVGLVRNAASSEYVRPTPDLDQRLVGTSDAISRVRWRIAGLAPLRTPVLVSGEPGSGRSTVITAIHELGATSSGELVHLDAASYAPPSDPLQPPTRPGRGGSPGAIHLEGVDRLTPEAQTYWARWLAGAERRSIRESARVLASTTESLATRVREGAFDLRLGNLFLRFHVEVPPLRARVEDVPALAQVLVERIGESVGRSRVRISTAALDYLQDCHFAGNVRQLEQLLERATVYSVDRVIRDSTLAELRGDLEDSISSMREERNSRERERLLGALQETGGNITQAAELLGRSRTSVYRLIAKHRIPFTRRSGG